MLRRLFSEDDDDDPPSTQDMLDEDESLVIYWWVTGGLLYLINITLTLLVFKVHLKMPSSIQRTRLLFIASCPFIIGSLSYASLFNLKMAALCEIIRTAYTGFSVYALYRFLFDLFGGWGGFVQAIETAEPSKFFAVPPFCCLCRPCSSVSPFTEPQLIRISIGMLQIIFFKPVLLSLAIILYVAGSYEQGDPRLDNSWLYIQLGLVATTVTSVYCMNVLRFPLGVTTNHYNLNNKFRTVMNLIVLVTVQQFIFNLLASMGVIDGNDTLDDDNMSVIWNNYFLIITSSLVQTYIWFYWSVKDYSVYNRYVEVEDRVTDPLMTL